MTPWSGPFELEVIDRAIVQGENLDLDFPFATPEDLIVMKLVAGRPRDIEDVRALAELHPLLDLHRIRAYAKEFAAILDQGEILDRLERLLGD